MGKQLAIFISYLFHPLWMPLYVMLIFWNIDTVFISNDVVWLYILLVVFINTLLIPVLLFWMMKRLKIIESLHLDSQKDRFYPFAIIGIFYLTTWYVFNSIEIFTYLSLVFVLAAILVFFALAINFFWKISIHSMSMGAMSTAVLYLAAVHFIDEVWPVYLIFILSGLVGYARLKLKAHSSSQVYIGYILGTLVVSIFFFTLL